MNSRALALKISITEKQTDVGRKVQKFYSQYRKTYDITQNITMKNQNLAMKNKKLTINTNLAFSS